MGMCMPSQGRESLAENPAQKNVVTPISGPNYYKYPGSPREICNFLDLVTGTATCC